MRRLLTPQILVETVADRWMQQYGAFPRDSGHAAILNQLKALNPTPSAAKEINRIIGNESWTRMPKCDQCQRVKPALVLMGEEPDYESATAWVCQDCLVDALKLFP